jgi:hypothetical protein
MKTMSSYNHKYKFTEIENLKAGDPNIRHTTIHSSVICSADNLNLEFQTLVIVRLKSHFDSDKKEK